MDRDFSKRKSLNAWDSEAILLKIEKAFGIEFDSDSLKDISSMGNLCDLIANKINLEHADTCTTQHAFYLVRNAVAAIAGTEKCTITPQTRLAKIFPRETRIQAIADMETEMGFQINLLQPKQWVIILFSLVLLGSFIAFYFSWQIAAAGCLASVLGLKLAGKFGKEIHLKTVGDLANKISRESYIKSRRNPVMSKSEIEQKVSALFAGELELEPVMISRRRQF